MKRGFSLFLFIVIIIAKPCYCQYISLSDSTITFKNPEGKLLTKDEARQLMNAAFSLKQEVANGKKIITIIPSGNDERAFQQAKMEAFKTSLINKPITAFKFTGLDNKTWNLKELKGKVVIINCWFTACKPCIIEMPLLNELVTANTNNPVIFLAPAPEDEARVKKFLKKFQFDYTIIPSSSDFFIEHHIQNFPTHLVIDKEGIIRQVFIGYSDDIKTKLQQEIDKLIKS